MGGLEGVFSLIAGPAHDWSNLSLLNGTNPNPFLFVSALWLQAKIK